ncbi:MAG: hypothetical protein Kow0077_09050 [Anaerolineae bacterium]
MALEQQILVIGELLLAAMLSMLIGLDRERRHRPAGMRTHMLVGIGSCLFTVLSVHGFPGSDTSRVAANIVTGIGFLGAGTIIQHKSDVRDLTTAASIWTTAAVGMAAGLGLWFVAIVATLIVWTVLAVLRLFQKKDDTFVRK